MRWLTCFPPVTSPQVEERGYAAPFEADPRRLHLIGCAFDPKTRLLSDWKER